MKSKMLFAAFCAVGLALSASADVILTDDVEYTIATAPSVAKVLLQKNMNINFTIEEDNTTGYVWSATYDKSACQVTVEHKANENTLGIKKTGKAKVKIVSLTDKPFTVELDSSKPWERATKKGKFVTLKFNVPDAAEFKSPREEGGRTSIPEGSSYSLQDVPASGIVNTTVGKDFKIKIEEDMENGNIWSLTQWDPANTKVEIEHDRGTLTKGKAEIEIKAFKAGYTILKFAYGNPGKDSFAPKRTITCFVIIH